ncbi:MAG: bifunctional biotin--[acetyl-CoA-carboxylase] synthetase/biotin operon repressor, partial [Thermoplasmata archaeon]|nr:bifunctional biotin--[acetyl-CoA-carboxylase] synthetase/biotin operon repressor [Thermoplasmata archaeon]
LQERATTIHCELGADVNRADLLASILTEIDRLYTLYESGDMGKLLDMWREHALTLGRSVKVQTPAGDVVGEAVDIDGSGALVIMKDGEKFTVLAGDCMHLR